MWVFREKHPDLDVIAPIRVGNNVFIGADCLILPGVTIGDDVVIGARSVVSRDIPAGCVAAGTPAKPIRPLEAYYQKVLDCSVPTKSLAPADKKAFLLKQFGLDGEQRGAGG